MRTQPAMPAFRAASYPCTRLVWHRQHVGLAEMQESSSQTHSLLKASFGGCHMFSFIPFFL